MIAVDANGADQGPAAVAEGVARSGLPVLLFGPAAEIAAAAGPHAEVVDAPETVKAGEEAVAAVRSKRDASIVQAAAAVGDGRADALVSAGSTGPTLAAATLVVKRIKGVYRPALAVLMPIPGGPCCCSTRARASRCAPSTSSSSRTWARASWRPWWGSSARPSACCRWARSPARARPDVLTAHDRIAEAGGLNFVGNLEGFDIPAPARTWSWPTASPATWRSRCSRARSGRSRARSARASAPGAVSTLGGLLIRGKLGGLRDDLDPEKVGGAILLGLRKPVVVAHGSFGPTGIEHAVKLARRAVDEDMVGRTTAALEAAGALRSAPAASVAQR